MTDDETLHHLLARRERVGDLKARLESGELSPQQFTAEIGKLWGAPPDATPKEIIGYMTEYVKRTAPNREHAERVFADALRRLKAKLER